MSIKSQRVKDLLFGKGTASFEAYMAGRHVQSRVSCIARARIEPSLSMRLYWVKEARNEHHRFLKCVAKIKQLEAV